MHFCPTSPENTTTFVEPPSVMRSSTLAEPRMCPASCRRAVMPSATSNVSSYACPRMRSRMASTSGTP